MVELKRLGMDEAMDIAKGMARELSDIRAGIEMYDDYYNGLQAPISYNKRVSDAYGALMEMSVSNWCRLIVDVVSERLTVGGIRSSQEPEFDTRAWEFWQANNLDAGQVPVHTEALKSGLTYVAVWPREGDLLPRIVGESPTQVHVRYDEVTGDPLYGVKVWEGRYDRFLYVTLYDEFAVYRFRSSGPGQQIETYTSRAPQTFDLTTLTLEPRPSDDDGGPEVDNPLGAVPFVLFPTQPDLLGGYTSELQGVITIQDRINKTTADRMMTQEFHAFPQRWVTGIDIPTDENGQPVEPFDSALDRLWTAVAPDTQFGQFQANDSGNFLRAIEADIQSMSTQSRTPPHYLMAGMGQFPSGESVRATEYGLSRKVEARQQTYGEAWEQVVRLAAIANGDTALAEDTALHVEWADVEARSEGELVDALLKMSTLGVPQKVLWERWGISPQEAERWQEQQTEEQINQATLGMAIGQGSQVMPVTEEPEQPPIEPVQ